MILSIICAGDNYKDEPSKIINQLKRFDNKNWDVKILTDNFGAFSFGEIYNYQNKIFSYIDKLLFPLRLMEKYKTDVVYCDHDWLKYLTDDFIDNFNGHDNFLYPEGWKFWNGYSWEQWEYLTDYNEEYFNPIIKYWEKNNYNYSKFKTVRECFLYFPYTNEISNIIYEIEKIKPIFEYMSIVGNNGYSAYGSSEGVALSYVLEKFNLKLELLSTDYYNYTYFSPL
jgi:hypothetical protein